MAYNPCIFSFRRIGDVPALVGGVGNGPPAGGTYPPPEPASIVYSHQSVAAAGINLMLKSFAGDVPGLIAVFPA